MSENGNGNGAPPEESPKPEDLESAVIEVVIVYDASLGRVTEIRGPLPNQPLMLGILSTAMARVNRMHDKLIDKAEAKRIVTPPPGLRLI